MKKLICRSLIERFDELYGKEYSDKSWFSNEVRRETIIQEFYGFLEVNSKGLVGCFLNGYSKPSGLSRLNQFHGLIRYECMMNGKVDKPLLPLSEELVLFSRRFDVLGSLSLIGFPGELWSEIAGLVIDSIWVSEEDWLEVEKQVKARKRELFAMPEYSQRVADYLNGAL